MKFFDAHCHLNDDALFPDLGKVVERAVDAGVRGMAVCGTNFRDWKAGVGETGLNFSSFAKAAADRQEAGRAEQEECFAAHLDLARELNRPVAIHCVRAWGRLVEILRLHTAPPILLHAFAGALFSSSFKQFGTELFTEPVRDSLSFITQAALGFVAFSIRSELSMTSLKRLGNRIVWIIFSESFAAFPFRVSDPLALHANVFVRV